MTTYHEPPLQSRRAARESERGQASPALDKVDPFLAVSPAPVAPQPNAPQPGAAPGGPPQTRAEARARVASESTDAPRAEATPPRVPDPALTTADSLERTLTRRELRALREAQGLSPAPQPADAPAPSAEPPSWSPAAAPSPAAEPSQAAGASRAAEPPRAEAPPTRRGRRAASVEPDAHHAPADAAPAPQAPAESTWGGLPAPVAPPPAAAPAPQQAPQQQAPQPPAFPTQDPARPHPEQQAPWQQASRQQAPEQQAPPPAPSPEAPAAPAAASATSSVPVGHWSRQAELDDELDSGGITVSRGFGSPSAATNALVLPSGGLDGPLSSTGEVFITGSIQLPRSLASMGAHPDRMDSTDLDFLDPDDYQVAATDSQPVRAVRAVSTHTGSTGVIGSAKPRSNRGFTALVIAAGTMAVLVAGILVVAIVSGQLF